MGLYNRISFHRMLVNDRVRTDAYREAINQTVQEGDIVLDIGTGSGILAFLACQAGAERVYAIDKSDIIHLAKKLARENGFADKIEFINDDMRNVTISDPVDVIVSELISKSILGQRMEELIEYSREKFLKINGKIIPEEVIFYIAPVEVDSEYQKLEFPENREYGIDFSYMRELGLNLARSTQIKPVLLSNAQIAYHIVSQETSSSQHPDTTLQFALSKAGTLHGFMAWFSGVLSSGTTISNYPPGTPCWDNMFFPLLEPVELSPEMIIDFHLNGVHPKSSKPVWRWKTTIRVQQETGEEKVIVEYKQSTFKASPTSKDTIYKKSSNYVPKLSKSGDVVKNIYDLCDSGKTVEEIAEILFRKFQDHWKSIEECKVFVHSTLNSMRYSGELK